LQFLRTKTSATLARRESHRVPRAWQLRIGFQLVVSSGGKYTSELAMRATAGFVEPNGSSAFSIFSFTSGYAVFPRLRRFLHFFRYGNDAVVGAHRNDVISAAHFCIEMRK